MGWSGRINHCLWLIILLLTLTGRFSQAARCQNRLDLVIIIDASSSDTAANLEELKSHLKAIVSVFTIGPAETRLALISAWSEVAPEVMATFQQVGSLSDFNAAVDRVRFQGAGSVDFSDGMRIARQSVMAAARTVKIVKVLLLLKDRRTMYPRQATDAARARMSSEANAVKTNGVSLHAVGLGGLWLRLELVAIFGTDYLLFKNANKAAESIKSLNNQICEADCPDKGMSIVKSGFCSASTNHVVTTTVQLAEDANQLSVCRREIDRSFVSCSTFQRCDKIERTVGPCGSDGKVTVRSSWQVFDFKKPECLTNKAVAIVDCKDALKCQGQIADIIFILDRSSSMADLFDDERRAARMLMEPLDVGVDSARVGLMIFENSASMVAELGSVKDMNELMYAMNGIPSHIAYYGKMTFTDRALDKAVDEFRKNGRMNVPRFVFLITDGGSSRGDLTFAAAANIKNFGVTLYAIGVGSVFRPELETITAPESATNMVIVKDFPQLQTWCAEFANKICIRLSAPDPKLCDDNIFMQTVSACYQGKQQITKTEYQYDSSRQCIKSTHSTMFQHCRSKCIDPINANEYFEGDTWTTLCHKFQCSKSVPKPFLPQKSLCMAADGSCQDVGNRKFSCTDQNGATFINCQCVAKHGKPILVLDTY